MGIDDSTEKSNDETAIKICSIGRLVSGMDSGRFRDGCGNGIIGSLYIMLFTFNLKVDRNVCDIKL